MTEIIKRAPGWEFDIITAKIKPELASVEHLDRVHIYRLGSGKKSDKLFLPLTGLMLAKKLHRQFNYRLAWGIMASYGSLAASLFSLTTKKLPFFISVYEGDLSAKRGWWLNLAYRFIFRRAHRWQLVADISTQQQAYLEDERQIQVVKLDENWDLLAKRTKEMFQETEILSARL